MKKKSDLFFKAGSKKYRCGKKIYIMAVVNVTPDSFYDGMRYYSPGRARKRIMDLAEQGIDFFDIGGESSRPGSRRISAAEETARILPVLRFVKKRLKIPVSVDTCKSEVAKAALDSGADMINDISGFRFDPAMPGVIAAYKASAVIMHMQGTPDTMQKKTGYNNCIKDITDFLKHSIKIALDNGIKFDKIIIDPGIGFGKTARHNYLILKHLSCFRILKRPVLIGLSRKSLIGKVLNNRPEDRLAGTLALNTLSVLNGAHIIRVHDAREHRDMADVLEYYWKV